jgi:hypothetical protein
MKNISQLKLRTQGARESLQEFITAIKQLAHRAYPTLCKEVPKEEAMVETIKLSEHWTTDMETDI